MDRYQQFLTEQSQVIECIIQDIKSDIRQGKPIRELPIPLNKVLFLSNETQKTFFENIYDVSQTESYSNTAYFCDLSTIKQSFSKIKYTLKVSKNTFSKVKYSMAIVVSIITIASFLTYSSKITGIIDLFSIAVFYYVDAILNRITQSSLFPDEYIKLKDITGHMDTIMRQHGFHQSLPPESVVSQNIRPSLHMLAQA